MIRKLKSSLTVRIFVFTSLLLCTVCAFTYGFIALFMPITYTSQLDNEIEQKVLQLMDQLRSTKLTESGTLLDQFQMTTGTIVSILDEGNETLNIPGRLDSVLIEEVVNTDTEAYYNEVVESDAIQMTGDRISVAVAVDHASEEKPFKRMLDKVTHMMNDFFQNSEKGIFLSRSQSYTFSFADTDDNYQLVIVDNIRGVNQAIAAMDRILPWLVLVVMVVALMGSMCYARFITRPIVRLSHISQQLARLDFQWQCNESRSDEIGLLARNFNILSEKLSYALNELQQANAALQNDIIRERELEQQRLEFFAAVSHELKTPITIIKGQLEGMLYQVGSYQDRDKYLARSLTITNRLESMVQEILTISRMETREFAIKQETINMIALVQEQLENYSELIKRKHLDCHTQMPPVLYVKGDRMLLQKVLSNLLSNAVHYSPGGAQIDLHIYEERDSFYFSIANTGVQLSEEVLGQLFQPFSRAEKSRNRQTGGSGLGLYLVRMILEQHGARPTDYGIRNTENGVLVYFQLPIGD